MGDSHAFPSLHSFVEDEMLRAPLLFDQVIDGALSQIRQALPGMPPMQRTAINDLMQAMLAQRERLSGYFVRSLRQQTDSALARRANKGSGQPSPPVAMALVDEEEVALDVELSHTIEAIKSTAEHEMREMQTYMAALVGDMQMAQDHNPFRPETYARALWAAGAALPLSRSFQLAFLRHASAPLAQTLRLAYAASTSRLEIQGVEPAAFRTLILPSGSRRGHAVDTTFSPDLQSIRDSMPLPAQAPHRGPPSAPGTAQTSPRGGQGQDFGVHATSDAERQSLELVGRLFDAITSDPRVPADVLALVSRLRSPAMRLSLNDAEMLEQDVHPLWRFINRLAYEAEMAPSAADPERLRLLKVAQRTIEQLASESKQTTLLFSWALERLDVFLRQRLARRCTAAASQIGALQKLEDKLTAGQPINTSMHGALDVPQLDTVPAELMSTLPPPPTAAPTDDVWLDQLRPGEWLRMFLQGQWVHVQLLWPGERREIWLFGDGASDATWAVRRRALVAMRNARLLKGLTQRSLVRRAAKAVREQVADAA